MEKEYKFRTKNGEKIFTKQGNKGQDDIIIWSEFPTMPWMHSLEYIGYCLRLKAMVESRNYNVQKGFAGEARLFNFCDKAIHSMSTPIPEICHDLKIPGY